MLDMRPDCERCGTDLPAQDPDCANELDDLCANCGGELMDRPTRARKLHEKFPPATKRKAAA